MKYSIF